MRHLLIVCCLLAPLLSFSQKIMRTSDWCAESRKTFAAPPPSATDGRSDSIDILHTSVYLELTGPIALYAQCRITFTPKVSSISEIRLDLENYIVSEVWFDTLPNLLAHTFDDDLLTVFFQNPIAQGDTATITVNYSGDPVTDASGWGGVYHTGNYWFNLGVGFAADPHSFGRAWFPCFDNFVERSTFEVSIYSPKIRPGYSNGTLVEVIETPFLPNSTRRWRIEQPIPSYLACFAAGPYVSWTREYDGIPVEIAAAAADTNKVKSTFQNLPKAIACFKHWFGAHKWPKIGYSLVPFSGGAMEHPTNIAIGQPFVDGSLTYETLWAHELSHHWWGDLATCSTAEDMWLNEGWAVFSEQLFTEWVYGPQAYRDAVRSNFLDVLENAHVEEGGYRAVSGLPHNLTYGTHTYDKGAVVAHNLRGYLGDSLFRTGIQTALDLTSFDDWSSAELRDKLSAATGQDMTDFFEDWVFAPGFPHFSIDSVQHLAGPANFCVFKIFVKQKLRGAAHFYQNVPLEFTVVNENWQRTNLVGTVSGELSEMEFSVPVTFCPKFIWVNINQKLTLARAEKEWVVITLGSKSFAPAKMTINVTALPDSALIRVEHHYAMPDTAGNANPNGYLLTNRYWTVEADLPAGFDGMGSVFFDGRGQLDQLDTELFAQTSPSTDSILLLYRPAPGVPWTEYPDYSVTTLSSRYGFIRIQHIVPGQYTIAKGVSTVSTHETADEPLFAQATPNPASHSVRLSAMETFDRILIFNEKGQTLREQAVPPTHELEVSVAGLPAGRYWFVVFTEKGATSCPVVVAK